MASAGFPTTFSELRQHMQVRLQETYDEESSITNLDKIIDDIFNSSDWRAKVAAIEMGYGKPPLRVEQSGDVNIVFQVEHVAGAWLEADDKTEELETVDAEYKVMEKEM